MLWWWSGWKRRERGKLGKGEFGEEAFRGGVERGAGRSLAHRGARLGLRWERRWRGVLG